VAASWLNRLTIGIFIIHQSQLCGWHLAEMQYGGWRNHGMKYELAWHLKKMKMAKCQ
jgi:hypothetical protein